MSTRAGQAHPAPHLWEGEPCDTLERALLQAAAEGRAIVVDLSGVASVTAHCLGILARAHEQALAHGGRVVLCGANAMMRWLLVETGLDRALAVFEDRASALRAAAGSAAA